jgi:hypothetical protein
MIIQVTAKKEGKEDKSMINAEKSPLPLSVPKPMVLHYVKQKVIYKSFS